MTSSWFLLTFVNQGVNLPVAAESCECLLQLLQAGGREVRVTEQVIGDSENLGELRQSLEYVDFQYNVPLADISSLN